MGELSKAQREALCALSDWKSLNEVTRAIRAQPGRRARQGVEVALFNLLRKGLAEFNAGNETYRITDAGRAAIQETK